MNTPTTLAEAAKWCDREYERLVRRREHTKLMDKLRGRTITQRAASDSNHEGRLLVLAEMGCLMRFWARKAGEDG